MDTSIKNIILIHYGNSFYLEYILARINSEIKNSNLYLIGDKTNKQVATKYGFKHYIYNDYISDFNYVHFSINSYDYEKFCIQRWLILCNFANKQNILNLIYFDSDVIVLNSRTIFNKFYDFNNYDVFISANNMCVIPCLISFNIKALNYLSEHIKQMYNLPNDKLLNLLDQISDTINNKKHVSDMYILRHIFTKNSIILNTLNNINTIKIKIKEYPLELSWNINHMKNTEIILHNNIWTCNNKEIYILHLQGDAKLNVKTIYNNIIKKNKIIL